MINHVSQNCKTRKSQLLKWLSTFAHHFFKTFSRVSYEIFEPSAVIANPLNYAIYHQIDHVDFATFDAIKHALDKIQSIYISISHIVRCSPRVLHSPNLHDFTHRVQNPNPIIYRSGSIGIQKALNKGMMMMPAPFCSRDKQRQSLQCATNSSNDGNCSILLT